MTRIEDLIGKKPKKMVETDDKMFLGGAFSCQTCDEIVDEAEMDKNSGEIFWKCKNNHESKVSIL